MIARHCRRLAEVDFPISVVSRYSVHEQEQHDAHPKVLHMWWARRPLGACRAMLLALLLPDPADATCPESFKRRARQLLSELQGPPGPADMDLRQALLRFIGEFSSWSNVHRPAWLTAGRGLIDAAYSEAKPLIADPFAGGGSVPLEALRVGAETFASDLNPVAGLILKVLLEDIPRNGIAIADTVRRLGDDLEKASRVALASYYPDDPNGEAPIAYLWCRTIRCEAPACGAEIPLARSLWLSKNPQRRRALRIHVDRRTGGVPDLRFEIFTPKLDTDVAVGTVRGAKATCQACRAVVPPSRVRALLREQRGGADVVFDSDGRRISGARLLAVVTLAEGQQGRRFRLPLDSDYGPVKAAQAELRRRARDGGVAMSPPDEPLPPIGTLGFRVQQYGMTEWGDLFTARQKLALLTMGEILRGLCASPDAGPQRRIASLALSKLTNLVNAGAPWKLDRECPVSLIAGQRLPPLWDWCEAVPTSRASGSLASSLERVAEAVERSYVASIGNSRVGDAADTGLPDGSVDVFFTDPPYYNAIPYADLSDFYFVWLKRFLAGTGDGFEGPSEALTPKALEAVQDESKSVGGRVKDRAFFEERVAAAFSEGRRTLDDDGIGCVVFAHQTTEGWEALLGGLTAAGWVITASWPIATEMRSRLRARASAALATSVHLVCRPREADAGVGDWRNVLGELPGRVGDWMERLEGEGIRGADLVFACIGPALEIFSRYKTVETAEGREVKLDEYLEKVWEVVGRTALGQVLGTAEARARNGASGAIEEDARLTALFLWTLQATDEGSPQAVDQEDEDDEGVEDEEEEEESRRKPKGLTLVFDVVRRFAQPLGIELPKWEGRVIEKKKGVVRLLPVAERARQLFGEDGAQAVASRIEQDAALGLRTQLSLFPDERQPELRVRGRGGRGGRKKDGASKTRISDASLTAPPEATTLDRVHAAMLLQAGGRTNALRALVRAEQERSPDFVRLANALSALYPKASEEKRLLDAMLLAVPR